MLGYLYGKRFGSKIARANRKEGDRPSLLLAQAILQPNLFPYKYPNILKRSHSSYLPTYKDGTECSETSAYKIQTPGNYPEESTQICSCVTLHVQTSKYKLSQSLILSSKYEKLKEATNFQRDTHTKHKFTYFELKTTKSKLDKTAPYTGRTRTILVMDNNSDRIKLRRHFPIRARSVTENISRKIQLTRRLPRWTSSVTENSSYRIHPTEQTVFPDGQDQ